MHKDGINPGKTAPILMVVTIFFKLVLVIAGLLLYFIRPSALLLVDSTVLWWAAIGWIFNVIAVTLFVLLVIFPDPVERVCLSLFRWLSRRNVSKDRLARWEGKLKRSFCSYYEVSQYIRNGKRMLLLVLLISVVQRTFLFSVTWLVIRSFNILNGASALEIILLQAMIALGTDMIPLPGGSGANEAMFLLLFGQLCGETLAISALIASRGISYYGQLLICGTIFIIFGRFIGKNNEMSVNE